LLFIFGADRAFHGGFYSFFAEREEYKIAFARSRDTMCAFARGEVLR
jgi:hypothetical protein